MSFQLVRLIALPALLFTSSTLGCVAQGASAYDKVVFLDQGWSQDDRLLYYNTSQGSAALSYDIFLNLEMADSQELFRSNENAIRYGLTPQPPDPIYNPDGLPLGIARTAVDDGRFKGQWAGLTCAACHNGQLEYKGTKIRVSGGTNTAFDVHAFVNSLDDALRATVSDPAKFERLVAKLDKGGTADKEALRKRIADNAAAVNVYRTRTALTPTVVGPGRVDALALIHNQVQSNMLGISENWRAALAPVKYSFVWNLPQSAWAQWSGVLKDPLLRNGGESLGVFVQMDLTSKTPADGLFYSTIDFKGQFKLEQLLRRLAPPKWPEEILGPIDRAKATKGSQLFGENCAGCHSRWPHRWSEPKKLGKRFIENAIVSEKVVGTDSLQFRNPQFQADPTIIPGALGPFLETPYTGAVLAPPPAVFLAATRGIFDRALKKLGLSDEELLDAHGFRAFYPDDQEPVPALFAYKANAAEGMWASPPFLHNGSVPNLYELLLPAKERSKTFFIGREFDPMKVGVDTTGESGRFLFDTSLIGNSNAGHSFENGSGRGIIGRLLNDDERWALVEYLKSIPAEARQITPYGGPKDPVQAWKDPTFFNVRNPGSYNGAPELMPVPTADEKRR
jgi:hypothetical protein